jgi:hypothetical protein
MVGTGGSFVQGGHAHGPMRSLRERPRLVRSRNRSGAAWPLMGPVIVLLDWAWADAGVPGSPATPAEREAPATSEEPKYLHFWSSPEKTRELAERVGRNGDGKTRLLGFGLPNPTFELEDQLPNRIRGAFAATRPTTWP